MAESETGMGFWQKQMIRWKWHDWAMLVIRTVVLISVLYNVAAVQDHFAVPFWLIDAAIGLSYIVPFILLHRNRTLYVTGELLFFALLIPILAPIDAAAAGNFVLTQ